MTKSIYASIALFACGGAATTNAGTVNFSDGSFASGWSDAVVINQNTSSLPTYVTGFVSSGGNTGSYRQESHTANQSVGAPSLAGIEWMAIFAPAQYNPSASGAIQSVDFSYDLLYIANAISGLNQVNVGYGLMIRQNNTFYRVYFGDAGGTNGWASYSHTGLTSANFVEQLNS